VNNLPQESLTKDSSESIQTEPKPPRYHTASHLFHVFLSRSYWGILLLAIVPILLETIGVNVVSGMLVYFSLFWFFIFRSIVKTTPLRRSIMADILAYGFTAVLGTAVAFYAESFWVSIGAGPLLQSSFPSVTVPAFVVVVGLSEEFAKQIIVVAAVVFVRMRHLRVKPFEFMMMGISSGLGFSAVENVSYVQRGLINEVVHHTVGVGLVTALSRALYTPFLHAVFAGIAAYGLGLAAEKGRNAWWVALATWLLAACFHGFYDATVGIHVTWALVDVAIAYFVFLTFLLHEKENSGGA
jgi:RsiW-degrading membrane proteinase PrsW (M82 family)